MTPSEDRALAEAYRMASAEDAGAPSAATRQAILAAATEAARRRTPAANQSHYVWRGVAALAMFGVALLVWQQVDHRLPGELPVAAAETEQGTSMVVEQRQAEAEVESFAPPAASRAESAATSDFAAADAAQPASGELLRKQAPDPAEGPEAAALLRRHFPLQYDSMSPHSVWLVRDADGTVLRSGERSPDQSFAEVRQQVEMELEGRLLRPWRIHTLKNAKGHEIEFAIAQTP